jgi:hypothetical protein
MILNSLGNHDGVEVFVEPTSGKFYANTRNGQISAMSLLSLKKKLNPLTNKDSDLFAKHLVGKKVFIRCAGGESHRYVPAVLTGERRNYGSKRDPEYTYAVKPLDGEEFHTHPHSIFAIEQDFAKLNSLLVLSDETQNSIYELEENLKRAVVDE